MSHRVLVTGSRTWQDRAAVIDALDRLLSIDGALIIVHGNARGADRMAHNWALDQRWAIPEPHLADWKTYGKRAGMIRNAEMVALGADICLAFIRDNSPGATHCAGLAESAGIPVRRFTS